MFLSSNHLLLSSGISGVLDTLRFPEVGLLAPYRCLVVPSAIMSPILVSKVAVLRQRILCCLYQAPGLASPATRRPEYSVVSWLRGFGKLGREAWDPYSAYNLPCLLSILENSRHGKNRDSQNLTSSTLTCNTSNTAPPIYRAPLQSGTLVVVPFIDSTSTLGPQSKTIFSSSSPDSGVRTTFAMQMTHSSITAFVQIARCWPIVTAAIVGQWQEGGRQRFNHIHNLVLFFTGCSFSVCSSLARRTWGWSFGILLVVNFIWNRCLHDIDKETYRQGQVVSKALAIKKTGMGGSCVGMNAIKLATCLCYNTTA